MQVSVAPSLRGCFGRRGCLERGRRLWRGPGLRWDVPRGIGVGRGRRVGRWVGLRIRRWPRLRLGRCVVLGLRCAGLSDGFGFRAERGFRRGPWIGLRLRRCSLRGAGVGLGFGLVLECGLGSEAGVRRELADGQGAGLRLRHKSGEGALIGLRHGGVRFDIGGHRRRRAEGGLLAVAGPRVGGLEIVFGELLAGRAWEPR